MKFIEAYGTGISTTYAINLLKEMQHKGLITKLASGRQTRYKAK